MSTYGFHFDNSYARELEGFFAPWQAAMVPSPHMLLFNHALATQLGLDAAALDSDQGAAIFSGNEIPQGAQPLAQAYAGHQFGNLSPQLGDGRALLLGELLDPNGQRWDLHSKAPDAPLFRAVGTAKRPLAPYSGNTSWVKPWPPSE